MDTYKDEKIGRIERKPELILLLFGLLCTAVTGSVAYSSPIDPFPAIEIPIFDKGYQVKAVLDGVKKKKTITYLVQSEHPPAEILEFYDAYFNANGWTPFFETCQRNWSDVTLNTKSANPPARQLFAAWTNAQLNLKADLWIRYENMDNQRHDEVTVKCLLHLKVD
jgi:hypothetical protein